MFDKIVQRIPVGTSDLENDLIALIDMIEIELGLSTGTPSVRSRLSKVVSDIRQFGGVASNENVIALLEIIERLEKIEQVLSSYGFETAQESSSD